MMMEEFSIAEFLPEEILGEIFNWLDENSKKKVALTCKRFKEAIDNRTEWSIQLYNLESAMEAFTDLMSSNRKFHKVYVYSVLLNKLLQFFLKFGKNMKNVNLDQCKVQRIKRGSNTFVKILNSMPKVEFFSYHDSVKKIYSLPELDERDELPKLTLKKLTITNFRPIILKYLKHCEILALTIEYIKCTEDALTVWNYLSIQRKIEEITIHFCSSNPFLNVPIPEDYIPLALKKVILKGNMLSDSLGTREKLMRFFVCHRNTIEQIEFADKFDITIIEFIIAECHNLKTVSIEVIGGEIENFEDPATMPIQHNNLSIKTFKYYMGEPEEKQWYLQLIDRMPNIETLHLGCSLYSAALETLQHLRNLEVSTMYAEKFLANLPALRSLKIGVLHSGLNEFTKVNKSITDLHIDELINNTVQTFNIEEITQNLNLRSLKIESTLILDDAFLNCIRKYCPDIESVELNIMNLPWNVPYGSDIRGLRLRVEWNHCDSL